MKNTWLIMPAMVAGMAVPMAVSANAHAYSTNTQVEAAKLCTKQFPKNERIHGIPTHLLAAISSTESGRWNNDLGLALPWPWTINANGKGYYFDSKAEAIAKVRSLQAQGINSIDIGCMQVNLRHHPNAFSSLNQAFDPQYNVAYAASFLRRNYDEQRSWIKATAAYHSKTPKHGNRYLGVIEKNWNRIVEKVRTARAKQGLASGEYAVNVADRAQEREYASLKEEFAKADKLIPIRDVDRIGMNKSRKIGSSTKSMRIIKVRDAEPKASSNSVMVIRPQITNAKATVLESSSSKTESAKKVASSDLFVSQHGGTSSGVTKATSSSKTSNARSAPKFIFVE